MSETRIEVWICYKCNEKFFTAEEFRKHEESCKLAKPQPPAEPEPRSESRAEDIRWVETPEGNLKPTMQPAIPPEPPQIPRALTSLTLEGRQCYDRSSVDVYLAAMDAVLAAERTSHDELRQAMRNQGEAVTQYSRYVEELTAELNSRHRLDEFIGIAKDASGAYYNKALVDYQVSHAEELAAEKSKRKAAETALQKELGTQRGHCATCQCEPPQQTAKPEEQA